MPSTSKCFLDSHAKDVITAWGNEDVVLVVPPFASSRSPLLGPSILLYEGPETNIKCRVFYANLTFAAIVGPDLYERISSTDHHSINDAIFAPYVFNLQNDDLIHYIRDCQNTSIVNHKGPANISPDEHTEVDRVISPFLGYVVDCIVKAKPSIVGFSALGKQITSSLAIAKLLKAVDPGIITIMGGNCVTRPMGDALLDIAPMIDYVFSGEADLEFPRFCDDFFRDGSLPASKIIDCKPIEIMDSVKIPNFDDFFQQIRPLQDEELVPKDWVVHIPFESSRGCWWGEKCTCAFCSFNTSDVKYRSKSRKRIVSEIAYLTRKYINTSIEACDSVMPQDFNEVLNELAPVKTKISIYQVRATIEPSVMDICVKAGITAIAAGIESLSTKILRRLGKGVTALQNLKLLREARSRLIYVWWNMLVGVPGETEEDYEPILDILPFIQHFQPPTGIGRIAINRYSRYFSNPARFGITNVRPVAAYRLIYPANADLEKLAYTFDADFESIVSKDPGLCRRLRAQCSEWIQSWGGTRDRPSLSKVEGTDGWRMIKDTRKIAKETFTPLDREADDLLAILAEPTRTTSVPERFQPYLSELLERRFVIEYEDHYISLVTNPSVGARLRSADEAVRRE